MAFTQHIISCKAAADIGIKADDHPEGREDCTVIFCTRGKSEVVWHSHGHADIDPLSRLNPDVPTVKDHRS